MIYLELVLLICGLSISLLSIFNEDKQLKEPKFFKKI
ncbi:MAG: hypothetical protein ACJAU2_001156 [Maribacter sp.]|jgi:hypothetical protein